MRIEYWCAHCQHQVGVLDRPGWSQADAEHSLGLHQLSPVERSEWVAYHNHQDVLSVQTICETCQNAVESHPELLVEGKLLQ